MSINEFNGKLSALNKEIKGYRIYSIWAFSYMNFLSKLIVKNPYMTEKKVKFEFEKHNKNSVRYKEVPEDGMPPVIGSIYVQKWFAGDSKNIEVTINIKD